MTWRMPGIPGASGPSSAAETCPTEPAVQELLEPFKPCWGRGWLYFWKASFRLHCPGISMSQNPCWDTSLPHAGLAQPSLVLTRGHDLPFEEQCCPASWELWQTGPGRVVNSLPSTQPASHGETLKAPVEGGVSVKQKRDHSSQPLGTPSHAKGKSQGMLQPQKGIFGVCSKHPNLGLDTVWQSVWALPLAPGLAGGGNCGRKGAWRNKSLFQSGPGSLASTGTKRGMQRGSRSDLTRTASSTVRCLTSQPNPH